MVRSGNCPGKWDWRDLSHIVLWNRNWAKLEAAVEKDEKLIFQETSAVCVWFCCSVTLSTLSRRTAPPHLVNSGG